MKKRMLALFLAFSMTIGMLPGNMALANEGEGSSPTQTILAVQGSGTITDDDTLSELAYTDTAFIEASADGAPSGSVAAAWKTSRLKISRPKATCSKPISSTRSTWRRSLTPAQPREAPRARPSAPSFRRSSRSFHPIAKPYRNERNTTAGLI